MFPKKMRVRKGAATEMKKISRYKKEMLMSAAALGMVAGLTLESSMAYFTTYVSAGGSGTVNMGAITEITEKPGRNSKKVTVKNTSEMNECFVRVKVFCGAQFNIRFTGVDGNGKETALTGWTQKEGEEGQDQYWYYGPKLGPGESASVLNVVFDIPEDFDRDTFNAIVIQECTPVCYGEDGTEYADWSKVYKEYEDVQQGEGAGN